MSADEITPEEKLELIAACDFTDDSPGYIREELLRRGIACEFEGTVGILSVLVRRGDVTSAASALRELDPRKARNTHFFK